MMARWWINHAGLRAFFAGVGIGSTIAFIVRVIVA